MALFAITVEEVLSRTVIVDAEDVEEAIKRVEDAVDSCELILDADDFGGREIEPSVHWADGRVPDGADVSFYTHLGGE